MKRYEYPMFDHATEVHLYIDTVGFSDTARRHKIRGCWRIDVTYDDGSTSTAPVRPEDLEALWRVVDTQGPLAS